MYSYMYHTICSFINRSKMHMYMYYGVDDERHLVIPMHSIVLQYYSRTASAVQPNRPNRPRDIKEREPRSRTATLRNVHRRPFNPSVRSRFPEKGGPQQSRARGKKEIAMPTHSYCGTTRFPITFPAGRVPSHISYSIPKTGREE